MKDVKKRLFSFSYIHGRCALSCVCVFFRVSFFHSSPPRKRISLVLSLANLPPSLLPCAGIGGRWQVLRILYLCWCGFSPAQEYHLLLVCVCVCHRIRRFIKKNPFFVFSRFFFPLLASSSSLVGRICCPCVVCF